VVVAFGARIPFASVQALNPTELRDKVRRVIEGLLEEGKRNA
jgi:hypothetical protein